MHAKSITDHSFEAIDPPSDVDAINHAYRNGCVVSLGEADILTPAAGDERANLHSSIRKIFAHEVSEATEPVYYPHASRP